MLNINISINLEGQEYEVDLPDNTKSFYFNAQTQEVSLEFHDPRLPTSGQTIVATHTNKEIEEEDDLSIMDILSHSDAQVFASAAYNAKNPISEARKLANTKRNSYPWTKYRKQAAQYSCCIDFKDTDSCDNVQLKNLIDYYINDDEKVENYLKEIGTQYGTTSRSHRLNYAAYEVIKKVQANGNGSFYSEEDLKRPIEERVLLNYSILNNITTYPYHHKKLRWLHRIGKYIFGKYLYEYLMDGKLELLNDVPEEFKESITKVTEFIINLEKEVNKDYEIAPEGLFVSTIQTFGKVIERELSKFYPNLVLDLSNASYSEYIKQIPNQLGIIKYKIPASNYVRKEQNYRKLWAELKLCPGVRQYNVSSRTILTD